MSLILHPQNSFTVVRQIANHTDAATYYVRAVIRNAYTDDIIDTLDLTNRGSQRFSKNWQVPADTSGQGFYISIVTSVYTDSGYTTKSENYGDEETTYLVQRRIPLGGGSGGGGLDAWSARRIIKEELEKHIKDVNLDGVYGAIGALQREVNRIPKGEPVDRADEILEAVRGIKETDLAPAITAIEEAKAAIEKKEVTPETDITPILEALTVAKQQLATLVETRDDAIVEKLVAAVKDDVLKALQTIVSETTFSMAPSTMRMNAPQPKKEEPVPFDLNQLAS